MTRSRGAIFTHPGGDVETFSNEIAWAAFNIRDYPPQKWKSAVTYAKDRGVMPIPWARLAHVEDGENIETAVHWMEELTVVADTWQRYLPVEKRWILPNYEKEAETISPTDLITKFAKLFWFGNVGWSMQGWLPNDVNYASIAQCPVLLQIFPDDMRLSLDREKIDVIAKDCVSHARDMGFTYVGVTWQTYKGALPQHFDCSSWQHSTFPGNLVHLRGWKEWYA